MAFSFKRVSFALWLMLFPLAVVFFYYPVSSESSRHVLVLVFAMLVLGAIFYSWQIKWLRWTLISLIIVITGFLSFPSGPGKDRAQLRELYRRSLLSYQGCPYVWGGEGRFGVDCSGLVRRGLEDALIRYGWQTLNPYWIRQGIWFWWNDTTAKEIGRGYGGRTEVLHGPVILGKFDHAGLQPGDLAVTTEGIHVMAYLGDRKWIAADPGETRVTEFAVPSKNGYFSVPMNIVRWKILEDSSG